jgi:hypothetical protein
MLVKGDWHRHPASWAGPVVEAAASTFLSTYTEISRVVENKFNIKYLNF